MLISIKIIMGSLIWKMSLVFSVLFILVFSETFCRCYSTPLTVLHYFIIEDSLYIFLIYPPHFFTKRRNLIFMNFWPITTSLLFVYMLLFCFLSKQFCKMVKKNSYQIVSQISNFIYEFINAYLFIIIVFQLANWT